MTLVKTLRGDDIAGDLERAYVALSHALLTHRGAGSPTSLANSDPLALDALVMATEQHVNLRDTRAQCELIGQDSERPIEIFNNLGHMFVLLQALHVLGEHTLPALLCAPTQQSSVDGRLVCDLEGEGWVLEAFGGGNIKTNAKIAKDLRKLAELRHESPRRTFLALRESAWTLRPLPTVTEARNIRAACPPAHGGPFSSSASVTLLGCRHGVMVVEATEIVLDAS